MYYIIILNFIDSITFPGSHPHIIVLFVIIYNRWLLLLFSNNNSACSKVFSKVLKSKYGQSLFLKKGLTPSASPFRKDCPGLSL